MDGDKLLNGQALCARDLVECGHARVLSSLDVGSEGDSQAL